jgi:hypothetical protein
MNRTFEAVVNIDRILAAVDNVPVDLNRERLVIDLENIKRDYRFDVYARDAPTERRKSLIALIVAAEEFKKRAGEWEGNPWLYENIRAILPLLDALISEARGLRGPQRRPNRPIYGAVSQLHRVLRKHLGEEAVSIKQGVRGGFVNLAMVALEAMGIDNDGQPYTPSTIANAVAARR